MASVVVALFFGGCGKKKDTTKKPTTTKTEKKKLAENQIPLTENLLEDGKIEDFNLVENDTKDGAKADVLAANDDQAPLAFSEVDGQEEAVVEKDAAAIVAENAGYGFKTVYFNFDENSIKEDQSEVLAADVTEAKAAVDAGKDVIVQGHCCQIGSERYNLALSEQRAQAVKEEMIAQGIPAEKIKTIGFGYEKPAVEASNTSDRTTLIKELAPNRRAEIVVD